MRCRSCGETLNDVPKSLTVATISSLLDDDVPDFLFQYALAVLEEQCESDAARDEVKTIAELPAGIRIAYTLVNLDSEVRNGGFYQWFTNSSGKFATQALADVRLIGSAKHISLVNSAIELNDCLEAKHPVYRMRWEQTGAECGLEPDREFWNDVATNFQPKFDRMSSDFYKLEESNSLWKPFIQFVRQHPDECVHTSVV